MAVAPGGACLCEDVAVYYERWPGTLPREMSLLKVVENIIICFTDGKLRGMNWSDLCVITQAVSGRGRGMLPF